MGVIRAKDDADFRFLPTFAGFSRFIDAAPLSRSDLLPPDPTRHFPLEGKTRKLGTEGRFSRRNSKVVKSATVQSIKLREERFNKFNFEKFDKIEYLNGEYDGDIGKFVGAFFHRQDSFRW